MKKLHYRKIGSKGKNILMLPGWGFTSDVWLDLAISLSKKHTIFLVDLPGMGVNKNIKCDSMNELLKMLNSSFPDNYAVLGWSLGGMLGLLFASEYNNKVSAIIMINATLKWIATNTRPGMPPYQWSKLKDSYRQEPYKFLSWFASNQLFQKNIKLTKKIKEHIIDNYNYDNGIKMQHYLDILGDIDLYDKKCTAQLTYIYSQNDKIVPQFANKSDLDSIAKDNKIFFLENSGHAAFLTHQEVIIKKIFEALE